MFTYGTHYVCMYIYIHTLMCVCVRAFYVIITNTAAISLSGIKRLDLNLDVFSVR